MVSGLAVQATGFSLLRPSRFPISAIDPIDESDITRRINDGLPETLPEWIRYNCLTHLKIKLNGDGCTDVSLPGCSGSGGALRCSSVPILRPSGRCWTVRARSAPN